MFGGGGASGFGGFPSAGGPGGFPGMDTDSDDMGSSPFGQRGGSGKPTPPQEIGKLQFLPDLDLRPTKFNMLRTINSVKPLLVSLEDLYKGTTKKLKVSRKLLNGGVDSTTLEVAIKAGWKVGTKVRFAGAGNETRGGSQDMVFVIEVGLACLLLVPLDLS